MATVSQFISKQKILLVKIEGTYASDPTPTLAANAVEAMDISYSYPFEVLERNLQVESLSQRQPLSGKRFAEISFSCELKGSGTAGTAGELSPLLQACAFAETESGGVSVIYRPESIGFKSCYMYLYEVNTTSAGNFLLHKFPGCRGNVEIVAEAGQIAKLNFNFKAKYVKPSDVADPGDPTYGTVLPPVVKSASLSIDSVTDMIVQAFNINMANEISERPDVDDATSIHSFLVTGRKPTMNINPETVLVAEHDFFGDLEASTAWVFQGTIGATAGNITLLSGSSVTIDNIANGDRNGMANLDIPCHLNSTPANSAELFIVQT